MKKTILLFAMIFSLTHLWADNFDAFVDSTCSVTITVVQGGFCLQAEATGTAPFSYVWDNGDTNQTLCANTPGGGGIHCVTMTDANGCVATACGTLDPNGNNCYVSITQDSINGILELTAQPTGEAPIIFIWSTGELTPSINVTEEGDYCVTITDNSACEATSCITIENNTNTNCWVYINSNPMSGILTAVANGSAPYTYVWSTGENTESIMPTNTGYYCVTVTDDLGCEASDCSFYFEGGGNDTTCYVTVSQAWGTWCLEATGYGTAPFTYYWENGDTGSTYCPNNPNGGTFCVTMTDANGCVSTGCGTLGNNGQDSCWVEIVETNSGDLHASTNPVGGNVVNYQWSTGELTEYITPSNEGTYCVTITIGNGCTAEDCIDFDFLSAIYGYVMTNGDTMNTGDNGTAYLIKYDPVEESLTAVDEVVFGQGFFQFNDVPEGDYLIKAALGPNSVNYETNLPTYYESVLWWDEATTFTVQPSTAYSVVIEMVEGNNPGGPGFIGGLVSEGANFIGGADHRGDGDPMENVTMILLDENDNPISHTVSNADGEYGFDNLAWGTYKVFIEIAGIEHVMYLVTIGPENPSVENLDFIVDEDSAATVSIKNLVEENSIEIFPNPANDKLNLQLIAKESSEVIFSLMCVDGRTIFSETVELYPGIYTHCFDVNKLPSGIYFVNLIDGKETISRKVIKK